MTVKDLLLNQNRVDLVERALEKFRENEKDENEYHKYGYHKALMDMEALDIVEDKDHLIYGLIEHDVDDCEVTEHTWFSLININELREMKEDGVINEFHDSEKVKMPAHYSLMFTPWETILGYQVAPESFDYVDKLDLAVVLLYEMTFFGYDYEGNQETTEAEKEELHRRVDEIEEGNTENYKTIDDLHEWFLEMRKEAGEFDGKTDEEIKEVLKQEEIEREENHKVMVRVMLEGLKERYEVLKRLKKIYC